MLLLLVAAVLSAPMVISADNNYVRSDASGAETGTDWDSAFKNLPSTLIRGDTYYIADGSYSSYTFNDSASGTTEITIKKAISTDHGTDTGWDSSYGDGTATFSGTLSFTTPYWILNGQTRGSDWKGDYGFKIDTGQAKGISITTGGTTNITVQYTEIDGVGNSDSGTANDLIYITQSGNNFTIQYSYLHDSARVPFLFRNVTNGLIEYCYIARNESTPGEHSEGISADNGTDNWIVRHNIWEDIEGTGIIIFVGDAWEIYGNVFFETGIADGLGGNGAIGTWAGYAVTNTKVYNNTFVDLTGHNTAVWFSTGASGNVAYNNLWYGSSAINFAQVTHDYNVFEGTEGEGNEQIISSDPFTGYLSDDFHLSAATDNGKHDLGSPYNIDMDGKTRGEDGTWDRGAFEYSAGGGVSLQAPSKLRIK